MTRIRAETEQLRTAAARLTEEAGALRTISSALKAQGPILAGEFGQLGQILASMHQASVQAGELGEGVDQLGRSLLQAATALEEANTWRPVGSFGERMGTVGAAGAAVAGAAVGRVAGTSTVGSTVGGAPGGTTSGATPGANAPPDASGQIPAMLNRLAPTPQWRAVLDHTIKAEGMKSASHAHGAVVYTNDDGKLLCDRQWLNFGIISFALPGGTARDVLKQSLTDPAEATALRSSLVAHLQAHPGGTVDGSYHHLLRTGDPSIEPLSAEGQADRFISLVKTGSDKELADWVFKYANVPTVHQGVHSGDLRPEWSTALGEFLGRPASVEAQIAFTQHEYAHKALDSADSFHLHSVRSVAWFFDQHVQSGGPNDAMLAMTQDHPPHEPELQTFWSRYQEASTDRERLVILTELSGSAGSTVRSRRDEILKATDLTDEPFVEKRS